MGPGFFAEFSGNGEQEESSENVQIIDIWYSHIMPGMMAGTTPFISAPFSTSKSYCRTSTVFTELLARRNSIRVEFAKIPSAMNGVTAGVSQQT